MTLDDKTFMVSAAFIVAVYALAMMRAMAPPKRPLHKDEAAYQAMIAEEKVILNAPSMADDLMASVVAAEERWVRHQRENLIEVENPFKQKRSGRHIKPWPHGGPR